MNFNLKFITPLLLLTTGPLSVTEAETLQEDVAVIKAEPESYALRCVLNGTPRALAIPLSEQIAVGYDTWRGGVFVIWKPQNSNQFLSLKGAVYTGAHGPQATTHGSIIFQEKPTNKSNRYFHSNTNATLHYLGHQVNKSGEITLSFSFRNTKGQNIGLIQDRCSVEKNTNFQRHITISNLPAGEEIKIDFPKKLTWSELSDFQAIIRSNTTTTFSAKLP